MQATAHFKTQTVINEMQNFVFHSSKSSVQCLEIGESLEMIIYSMQQK